MALVYKDNAPVKFITGTYVGYDAENNNCNCFTKPWCQLVERLDTTTYQVGTTANTDTLVTDGGFVAACGVNWTCGTDWNIAGAVATKVPGIAAQALFQSICIMPNRRYVIQFTVNAISAGTILISLGGVVAGSATTTGTKVIYFDPNPAVISTLISFTDVAGTGNWTIDGVIVTELSQIGYEIETQTGTSIFTDISVGVATYFETTGQITVDWPQASIDDCYVICNHDASDYREMVCNGDFGVDAQWINGAWTIAGGLAHATALGAGLGFEQTLLHPLIGGRCYTLTFDIVNFVSGLLDGDIPNLALNIFANISGNGSFSFPIDLTGLANGTSIRFITSLPGVNTFDIDNVSITMQAQCFEEDACSECYKLGDTWDCSFLFSWTNDENAFGFIYTGLSFTQFFRHRVKLWQPSYPEEAQRFLNSSGTVSVLHALSQKVEDLTVEEMPEYLHDAFRLAWIHDTTTIETVNYTKEEGDYEPNWRKSSLLAPVVLDVRENGQDNENSNC